MWLKFLDIFFNVFHILLIIFNLFGWVIKPTRKLNLITVSLTVFSWFFLGLFYGLGYCPLTDLHYHIKGLLGQTNLPNSYIKYLFDNFTPFYLEEKTTEILALLGLTFCVIGSGISNYRDFKKRPLNQRPN